jgi:hypothetical protein
MTINISKSFNHVFKNARVMPISTLVQLTFYRYNDYWVKQRRKASNDIQSGVIWPPAIQIELIMSMDRSRDHIIVLFDSKK